MWDLSIQQPHLIIVTKSEQMLISSSSELWHCQDGKGLIVDGPALPSIPIQLFLPPCLSVSHPSTHCLRNVLFDTTMQRNAAALQLKDLRVKGNILCFNCHEIITLLGVSYFQLEEENGVLAEEGGWRVLLGKPSSANSAFFFLTFWPPHPSFWTCMLQFF